jgi:hypothetical protein
MRVGLNVHMDVENAPDLRRLVRVDSSTTIVLKVTQITELLGAGRLVVNY